MQLELADRAQAQQWVKDLAQKLRRPCVVGFSGDLGAGKTQFVRWLLEAIGVKDAASPTFAIHHAYESAEGPIEHLDLYRLQSDFELEGTGFWDMLTLDSALMLVEWADRLPEGVWPPNWDRHLLTLEKVSEEGRRLHYTYMPRESVVG